MMPDTPPAPQLGANRAAVLAAFFAQGFVFISATLFIPRIIATYGPTTASFSFCRSGSVSRSPSSWSWR